MGPGRVVHLALAGLVCAIVATAALTMLKVARDMLCPADGFRLVVRDLEAEGRPVVAEVSAPSLEACEAEATARAALLPPGTHMGDNRRFGGSRRFACVPVNREGQEPLAPR